MLKKTVLLLLLTSALANAQSFTNTVDRSFRNNLSLSYTVIPQQVGETVDQPLSLWFTYSGTAQSLDGELRHNGTTVSLFDNYTPSANPIVFSPINDFFGEPKQGAWVFSLSSDSHDPFTINQWGINVIPEPSTFALIGLGVAALLIFRKK